MIFDKNNIKKNLNIIMLCVVALVLCSCNIIDTLSGDGNFKYDIQNILLRTTENKEEKTENYTTLLNYLKNKYCELYDLLKIEYVGSRTNTDMNGIHGWYSYDWIRAYEISTPFMLKSFEVWVDNRTHEIFGDNFYKVLVNDKKFNYLYSNYVKKQIGINDPNVEFKFNRAKCGAQVIGDDIYIEFDKINDVDEIDEQICENIKNIYIHSNSYDSGVKIVISNEGNINDILSYADEIEGKIKTKIFIHKPHPHQFSNSKNELFIDILNKDNKEIARVHYNYDDNYKEYYDYINNSEWRKY